MGQKISFKSVWYCIVFVIFSVLFLFNISQAAYNPDYNLGNAVRVHDEVFYENNAFGQHQYGLTQIQHTGDGSASYGNVSYAERCGYKRADGTWGYVDIYEEGACVPCWKQTWVSGTNPNYIYFDIDDQYIRNISSGTFKHSLKNVFISIWYLDFHDFASFGLEYDAVNNPYEQAKTPDENSYNIVPYESSFPILKVATFMLKDAYFNNRQQKNSSNWIYPEYLSGGEKGADFRIAVRSQDKPLYIQNISISCAPGNNISPRQEYGEYGESPTELYNVPQKLDSMLR